MCGQSVCPQKLRGKILLLLSLGWSQCFGKQSFTPMFSVERAHSAYAPLPLGHPLTPSCFKLLNCKDGDVILAKARGMNGALAMDNTKISLFPD